MEYLIRQIPNWEKASAADILAYFKEETVELIPKNLNTGDVIKILGPTNAIAFEAGLRKAGYGLLVDALIGGLDFGDITTQDTLANLAQVPEFTDAANTLRDLGRSVATRWERFSRDVIPTEQEISNTVAAMKVNDAKNLVIEWRNSVLLPLVDAEINAGKTIAQVKTAIATNA